ncbi:unnamed protein product [Symbiodinium microadriaticum]|nr:unnamed protein product [Symbiodinium microadriaticum]
MSANVLKGGDKKGELIITANTTIHEASFSSYPGAFALRDSSTKSELYLHAESESEKRAWMRVLETTISDMRAPKRTVSTKSTEEAQPSEAVALPSATSATPENPTATANVSAGDQAVNNDPPTDTVTTSYPDRVAETADMAIDVAEVVITAAVDTTAAISPPQSPTKPLDDDTAKPSKEQPQTLSSTAQLPVDTVGAQEQNEELAAAADLAKLSSSESADVENVDAEVVEEVVVEESGMSADLVEEQNDKTDDELDAAMYTAVGTGAWMLKREGEHGGVYHSRFVWIDVTARELHWSKVDDKSAPSKSMALEQGCSVTDMKKSVKQRRASMLGTVDDGGFAFSIIAASDQSRNIGLKITDERVAHLWRSVITALLN